MVYKDHTEPAAYFALKQVSECVRKVSETSADQIQYMRGQVVWLRSHTAERPFSTLQTLITLIERSLFPTRLTGYYRMYQWSKFPDDSLHMLESI